MTTLRVALATALERAFAVANRRDTSVIADVILFADPTFRASYLGVTGAGVGHLAPSHAGLHVLGKPQE